MLLKRWKRKDKNKPTQDNNVALQIEIEGIESTTGSQAAKNNTFGSGVLNLNDIIAPSGLLFTPDHVCVGSERYVRSFYITAVPSQVMVGWLDDLYALGDVDVAVHLEPVDEFQVINNLTDKITELEAQLMLDDKSGNHRNISLLQEAARDAWQLRAEIQTNRNKMYWVTIVFSVAAPDLETLNKASKIVRERMGGRAVHIRDAFLRQSEGLKSVVPLGENLVKDIRRNFDLGAATALFPFAGADLAHPGGVFLGVNMSTGAPVFYNSFVGPPILANQHMGVIATSGAGKTTLVRLLTARSAVQGVRTLVLDPEGDYKLLCEMAGGVYVPLVSGRPSGINPFDLDPMDNLVNVSEKVADIKGLVRVMVQGVGAELTPEENIILEDTLRKEYESRGITEDPASLYTMQSSMKNGMYQAGKVKKQMPTLTSLWERLNNIEKAKRICLLLTPYLRGNSLGIFDCETQVDLAGAPIIVFDLFRLEENFLRPFAMHVVLDWVWETWVKKDKEPKRLICDEAWLFLKYRDTMMFLENIARRGRKRNCSLCVATQRFGEFRRSEEGQSVISNLDTLVLMQQNPEELDSVGEVFKLSDGQKDFLRTVGVGEALVRAGRQVAACKVIASEEEWAFINPLATNVV